MGDMGHTIEAHRTEILHTLTALSNQVYYATYDITLQTSCYTFIVFHGHVVICFTGIFYPTGQCPICSIIPSSTVELPTPPLS